MREQLIAARSSVLAGKVEAAAEVAMRIKNLPRTGEGLFDTSGMDMGVFQAAGYLYPVYAAYETAYNGKEGYPDLLAQWRVLDGKIREGAHVTFMDRAYFLDALADTIDCVSIQLYEYYRELVDMFREHVRQVIRGSSGERWSGAENKGGENVLCGEQLIRSAIAKACKSHVLLAEKYREYV